MLRRTGSLVLLALLACLPSLAEDKKAVSVIAGTVFREPGFALPGAVVTLAVVEGKKPKPQKVAADAHGEFAFRLPASETKFQVTATARGFASQTKEATAAPGVRVDVYFELKPESK